MANQTLEKQYYWKATHRRSVLKSGKPKTESRVQILETKNGRVLDEGHAKDLCTHKFCVYNYGPWIKHPLVPDIYLRLLNPLSECVWPKDIDGISCNEYLRDFPSAYMEYTHVELRKVYYGEQLVHHSPLYPEQPYIDS